jgi:hypothetical protein
MTNWKLYRWSYHTRRVNNDNSHYKVDSFHNYLAIIKCIIDCTKSLSMGK